MGLPAERPLWVVSGHFRTATRPSYPERMGREVPSVPLLKLVNSYRGTLSGRGAKTATEPHAPVPGRPCGPSG